MLGIAFEIGKIQIKLQSIFPSSTRDRNEFLSQSSRFPRKHNSLDSLFLYVSRNQKCHIIFFYKRIENVYKPND